MLMRPASKRFDQPTIWVFASRHRERQIPVLGVVLSTKNERYFCLSKILAHLMVLVVENEC